MSVEPPPEPGPVASLDDLARSLLELRRWAGDPPYAALAEAIGDLRAQRGRPGKPGKVTVYDCFRAGRKRLDSQLFVDLLEVLGVQERARATWLQAYRGATGGDVEDTVELRAASTDLVLPRSRLVGRDRELAWLEGRPPGSVTVIAGLPGAGKTELALHVANRWRRRLGPGALALGVNLRGYDPDLQPLSAATLLARLLLGLGVKGWRVDGLGAFARAEQLRQVVGNRPLVLLLDNADSAAQILPLLPIGKRWRVLVTSRRRLPELVPTSGEPLVVGELTTEAAVELLADDVGAERVAAEPDAAVEIAHRCGRLALDLRLAGAAIASGGDDWTLGDHAIRLAELPPDEYVRPALWLSYQPLTEPVRRTLRLAALHPGPIFTLAQMVGLAGLPTWVVATQLEHLTGEHLVMAAGDGFHLHDLVRGFALRRLVMEDPRSQQVAAMRRLAAVLTEEARAHADLGRPDSAWLERHFPVLVAFAEVAPEWELGAELGELVLIYSEFLDVSGRLAEAEDLIRLALAQPDVPSWRELQRKLGRVLELRGDLPGAHAALMAAAEPTSPDYGRVLNGIGNVLKRMGRHRDSVGYYRRSALHATGPMPLGRAIANLADTLRLLGHEPWAADLFDRAEAISTEADDEVNLAILRLSRCLLVEQQGRLDEALAMARELAVTSEELGFAALAIRALEIQARCLIDAGDLPAAAAMLTTATTRATEVGMPELVCALRVERGRLRLAEGEIGAAAAEFVEAIKEAERLGVALPAVAAYNGLGELAASQDDIEAATAAYEHAVELAGSTGDRIELLRAQRALAELGARG
ncbi:MAG: hypothetical protein U0R78_06705 [Nocardioidaceae bacterium]